ncbi:C-5 cytosine-specific DNA methylase [Paramagnetospirillum caucaseum]|uniref:DNA (cytosine-5-)-methyltransferase n=1 Tax=Paramagnetospirillum caucaseum TaxID=1244869 RepID=M2YEJ4_9PROT|nr:DNA cytosine methyltransferase [Paramagnetospirillum caucaseum]EME71406.1 C-5 cytosine-specific DNA methylase [Paramagnetospirillum caucaseum]
MSILFPAPAVPSRSGEIIVVGFAGGGGSCEGIREALGRSPEEALNHDPEAVAMHMANHPETRHWCQNIWQADPSEVAAGRPIGAAWFSPDCKHFSKAKGGKPREKNIRDLAWVVVGYARLPRHIRPRVIFLENVEEFQTWGPLLEDGTPCPDRRGETFAKWVGDLKRRGYRVQWRELRACDYGAPTIRKRLFLIARCDGEPIVWPEPTHGPGRPQRWRSAADIIDWSLHCPSIFERARPLADATCRRVATGAMRYVVNAAKPFIVRIGHTGHGDSGKVRDVSDPLSTICTKAEHLLVSPVLTGCGGRAAQSPPRPADKPMGTVTAKADRVLVAAHLTRFQGRSVGAECDAPAPTLVGVDKVGLVAATLVQTGYGEREGQAPRALDIERPLGTVVAGGGKHALVAAFLAKHYGGVVGHGVEQPIGTVTTADHHSVVAAHLTHFYSSAADGGNGDLDDPIKTVTASGQHAGLVAAFLTKYYGAAEHGQECGEPLHTVTALPRFGLVTVMVEGEPFVLSDLGLRMLTPRELFRAQGFPDSYIIDLEHNGKPLSKRAQVRMAGNSVCPPMAAALVGANVPEMALRREAAE